MVAAGPQPMGALDRSRIIWFPLLIVAGAAAASLFGFQTDPSTGEPTPYVYRWAIPFLLWALAFGLALYACRDPDASRRVRAMHRTAYVVVALGAAGLLFAFGGTQQAPGGVAIEGEAEQTSLALPLLVLLLGMIVCMLLVLHARAGRRELYASFVLLALALVGAAMIESSGFTGDSWALFVLLNLGLEAWSAFRFLRPSHAGATTLAPIPPVLTEPAPRGGRGGSVTRRP